MSFINPFAKIILGLGTCCLVSHCNPRNSSAPSLTTALQMSDGVTMMTRSLSQDLNSKGPIAWLSYFEQSPEFYMASDGSLAFPDFKAADSFLKIFSKQVRKIVLNLSSIRVDSISTRCASLSAAFTETLTDTSGKANAYAGFITGLADQTENGWQFRNLHWSIKH